MKKIKMRGPWFCKKCGNEVIGMNCEKCESGKEKLKDKPKPPSPRFIKESASTQQKICAECMYCEIDSDNISENSDEYLCKRWLKNQKPPIYKINLVTGKKDKISNMMHNEIFRVYCKEQRKDGFIMARINGTCGREGRFFIRQERGD